MIPTVFLDPAAVFLTGTVIALVWRRFLLLRRDAELERIAVLGAAAGLWYGLTLSYVFFKYPDWMLVYLQNGAQVYKPVAYAAFVFILAAAGAAGVASTGWLLLRGHGRLAYTLSAASLLGLLAIWRITWRQYWALGTTAGWVVEQYRALGSAAEAMKVTTRPLREVPELATAINVTSGLNLVVILAILGWRWWLGRKTPEGQGQKSPP